MVKRIIKKTRQGVDKVSIKTDERLFPIEVSCSHCNHSLMNKDNHIDGYPSIQLTSSFGDKHGWFRFSCLYGSYSVHFEHEIPLDTVIDFFCPHCHSELISTSNCSMCEAQTVSMIVSGGGMFQLCSRRGCPGHQLDL